MLVEEMVIGPESVENREVVEADLVEEGEEEEEREAAIEEEEENQEDKLVILVEKLVILQESAETLQDAAVIEEVLQTGFIHTEEPNVVILLQEEETLEPLLEVHLLGDVALPCLAPTLDLVAPQEDLPLDEEGQDLTIAYHQEVEKEIETLDHQKEMLLPYQKKVHLETHRNQLKQMKEE